MQCLPNLMRFRGDRRAPALFPATGVDSSLTYSQERFGADAVFLRAALRPASILRVFEALLGVGQLLFQRPRVEVLGGDRLLDQESGVITEDLQPAVGLRVAL